MAKIDDMVNDHRAGKRYKDDIKIEHKNETWSIREIKRFCEEERITLPAFQRRDAWKETDKSRLIESVLRGIPIPSIYVAEDRDRPRAYTIIDGQQRINSFVDYIDNKFGLTGLTILEGLSRQKYNNLTPSHKLKIDDTRIPVTIVLKDTDPDALYEIFERLNSGGLRLNAQELRNCMYHGSYNDLLNHLGQDDDFKKLIGSSWDDWYDRMLDAEAVLRFFAFSRLPGVQIDRYESPVKRFLNREMEAHRNLTQNEKEELTQKFKKAIRLTKNVFGTKAFRTFSAGTDENHNGEWGQINKGLYDMTLWGFVTYDQEADILPRSTMIKEALMQLMTHDNDFIDTLEQGTSDKKKVTKRFEKWQNELKTILKTPASPFMNQITRKYKEDPTCSVCNETIASLDNVEITGIAKYWLEDELPSDIHLSHRGCDGGGY